MFVDPDHSINRPHELRTPPFAMGFIYDDLIEISLAADHPLTRGPAR
jgi:hypothetical protein